MKVNRERNPYLKRIFSEQPHKYSYDIDTGKYFLVNQQGTNLQINPIGTFRAKFRTNFSGFVDHKARYNDAKIDPSVLHYAPDPQPNTKYSNPIPDKFAGYAQYPYKLTAQFPKYLKKPGEARQYARKKGFSLNMQKHVKKQNVSAILDYSTSRWTSAEDPSQTYFKDSWGSMSQSKPLPRQKKKTCYNYKCKFLKQWVFDQRGQLQAKKVETRLEDNTMNRSFHDSALNKEMIETKLLSTMAITGGYDN